MAKFILGVGTTAAKLTVGGTDLTDHLRSITINQEIGEVDVTAFNSVSVNNSPGLIDDSWELEFFQDFASSSVDATLYPLIGSATGATFIFQTNGGTVTSVFPKYTLVGTLYNYNPVSGAVGEASMNSVTVKPVSGQYTTRGTS